MKLLIRNIMLRTLLSGVILCIVNSCTEGPKSVVYVNSYHQEFPPSSQITRGVMENLPSDSFEVRYFFMDSKRNPQEAFIQERAAKLFDSIQHIDPDALIVSDDNAMKYLVLPYFRGSNLPIVFCGVNWSINNYDISEVNMTGVLEILPVADLVKTLRPYYPEMSRLLVLNENTTTSRKTQPILDTLLGNMGLEVTQELVDDFESWKSAFINANESFDIIYLQTRGAIKGWDDQAAREHIRQYMKIPTTTCEEFMMPYAMFGLTQLSEEQGSKAAQMAHQVLSGTDPADIPITRNQLSRVWINMDWAQLIGFEPDEELRSKATVKQGF